MRATLRTAGATTVAGDVRVACLPLFQGDPLRQAIRVTGAPEQARVAVRDGDTLVGEGVAGADLWVPEVDTPRTVDIAVEGIGETAFVITPQRKWTVHVVHHSHL